MSGTNKRQLSKSVAEGDGDGPAVILIEPQMGENIGAVARAMLNCGLTDLRIVNPRDGWPNEKAVSASAGATLVLDRARVFDNTRDAIADLHRVFSTAAIVRGMVKPVVTPREAANEMRGHWSAGRKVGLMFGPERTGLVNEDIALTDTLISVPLNPGFSSLNLAQAVLLIAYEWWISGQDVEDRYFHPSAGRPASKGDLHNLFDHLEGELEDSGFFSSGDKRPSMVRNIRNLLQRTALTEQEARTFHGIITALTGRKKQRKPGPEA